MIKDEFQRNKIFDYRGTLKKIVVSKFFFYVFEDSLNIWSK